MKGPGYFQGRRAVRATFDLPLAPSVNRIWRQGGAGQVYRAPEYVSWIKEAGWALKAQKPPTITGAVAVRIRVGLVDRKRDLDNVIKALLDLLVEHQVIADDSDVATIEARWDKTVTSGRAELEGRTSLPPAFRSSAETRRKVARANAARAAQPGGSST